MNLHEARLKIFKNKEVFDLYIKDIEAEARKEFAEKVIHEYVMSAGKPIGFEGYIRKLLASYEEKGGENA